MHTDSDVNWISHVAVGAAQPSLAQLATSARDACAAQ